MSLIWRLVTSTCPFVWGWYVVDNLWLMEYFCIRASKTLLQKCDPLSLIIALGVQNREKMFPLRNFNNHFVVIGLSWHSFYPFRDVIYSNQNELVTEGIREWSHVVDTPNIKNFDFKNRVQRHHVSSWNFPNPLIICTWLAKVEWVFEKSGPIKPTL